MALLGKFLTITLLAYASASPKIQHRAEGNSQSFNPAQYFSSEKLQQWFNKDPQSYYSNYLPNQSPSNNADVQSDTMLEDQSQQSWETFATQCMSSNYGFNPSSYFPQQSNAANPSSNSQSKDNSYSQTNYAEQLQTCFKKWQSSVPSSSYQFGNNQNIPSFGNYQNIPSFGNNQNIPNFGQFPNYLPSSSGPSGSAPSNS